MESVEILRGSTTLTTTQLIQATGEATEERDSIRCESTNKLLGRIDKQNNLYYFCAACHCLHQLSLEEIVKRQGDVRIDGQHGK